MFRRFEEDTNPIVLTPGSVVRRSSGAASAPSLRMADAEPSTNPEAGGGSGGGGVIAPDGWAGGDE